MGIYGLKPAFRRSLRPLARALGGTHPDAVSYAAVAFALLAGAALAFAPQHAWLYLLAPLLLFARIACNALDGMLAQDQGVASARGEIVNEFSDRVSDTLILGGLALGGVVHPLLAGGALATTLLVSYMGILPKAIGGRRNYAGPMGKADRMLLVGVASVVAWFAPRVGFGPALVLDSAALVLVVFGVLTLVNRTRLAWKEAAS